MAALFLPGPSPLKRIQIASFADSEDDDGMPVDTVSFLAKVAPAMTDAEVRGLWLSDPRAALLAAGIDVPEWADITCAEGGELGVAITLGPLIDVDGELNEESMGGIAGGTSSACFSCGVACN
jgi:hypothetical protein